MFFIFSCLFTAALGISWGEEFIEPAWGTALGALGLITLFSISRFLGKLVSRWFFALVLPLAFLLSWGGGVLDVQRAVGECRFKADQLREDLVLFKKKKGWYPVSLDQLGWARLPGNRLIGKSVLHYDFGPVSYQMYFSALLRRGVWKSCSGIRKE